MLDYDVFLHEGIIQGRDELRMQGKRAAKKETRREGTRKDSCADCYYCC